MIATTPEDCEYYTPPELLEKVYQVMPITLDPASPPLPTVRAEKYYTKEQNGLLQPWEGNVFLNPPYGRATHLWINKLVMEYKALRTQNCILLIHAKTDTQWFKKIAEISAEICCIEGRISFLNPSGKTGKGTFPSLLILVSTNTEIRQRFFDVFKTTGTIYKRIYNPEMIT